MWPKSFAPFEQMLRDPQVAGRHLLVAVSGGVDSVTLLHALHLAREAAGLQLTVAHVHHGLRGEAADADAAFVDGFARARGLACELARVDPHALREGVPQSERPTVQEAARRLRYAALEELRAQAGADAIATAHHLDDQAETVLLRLIRGTSPDGLGGMAPVSRGGRLVRPLLGVPRAAIEAFASESGLAWHDDASNESDVYTRNRLRNRWIPGLSEDFNPQLLRAVAKLAEAQRRDSAWIADVVREIGPDWVTPRDDGLELRLEGWGELPEALSQRLVERAVRDSGGGRHLSRTHIERALAFLAEPHRHEGGRALELPGGLRLERESKAWRLRRSAHPTRNGG